MISVVNAVFINGTVGVGKTSAGEALSALQADAGQWNAFIDVDTVRRLRPSPVGDRFQHELELQNLRDLANNYRNAGARQLILAGVIEDRVEIPRYARALRVNRMFVCRLIADASVVDARLVMRHANDPAGLEWHLHRNRELSAILDRADLDDRVVDSTNLTPTQIATTIKIAVGW
jgi:hypothetical protein